MIGSTPGHETLGFLSDAFPVIAILCEKLAGLFRRQAGCLCQVLNFKLPAFCNPAGIQSLFHGHHSTSPFTQ